MVGQVFTEFPNLPGSETVDVTAVDERKALVFSRDDGSTRYIPVDTLGNGRDWIYRGRAAV